MLSTIRRPRNRSNDSTDDASDAAAAFKRRLRRCLPLLFMVGLVASLYRNGTATNKQLMKKRDSLRASKVTETNGPSHGGNQTEDNQRTRDDAPVVRRAKLPNNKWISKTDPLNAKQIDLYHTKAKYFPPGHDAFGENSLTEYRGKRFSDGAARQIHSYRNGNGILIHVALSHQAGDSLCHIIGKAPRTLRAPQDNCIRPAEWDGEYSHLGVTIPEPGPWPADEIDANIQVLRNMYHYMKWPMDTNDVSKVSLLQSTNVLEHSHMLSLYVAREPIARLLEADADVQRDYPGLKAVKPLSDIWDKFAASSYTDNVALKLLSHKTNDDSVTVDDLEQAKRLLDRFTFVLDYACLSAGIDAISEILQFPKDQTLVEERVRNKLAPTRERIPSKDVYDRLKKRNKLDTDLYEYAKSISLVNCSDLGQDFDFPDDAPVDTFVEKHSLDAFVVAPVRNGPNFGLSDVAVKQIESFRARNGVILNVRILRHAGQTMCKILGGATNLKGAPGFVCAGLSDEDKKRLDASVVTAFPNNEHPWDAKDAAAKIDLMKENFHFFAWNYGRGKPRRPMANMDWENSNLVSIVVMRDPIHWILSPDVDTLKFKGISDGTASKETWETFVNSLSESSNQVVSILASSPDDLGAAKSVLNRMTFVLDQACLSQGLETLAGVLNLPFDKNAVDAEGFARRPPINERIPFPDIYAKLVDMNRKGIELYEYAKSISLVDCEAYGVASERHISSTK